MRKIYHIICYIYCELFTFIENIIYRKFLTNKNSELLDKGYELVKLNKSVLIKDKEVEIKNNPYLSKNILSKKQIRDLIENLFIENGICELITMKTGFKYSIDFIVSYKTYHIPISNSENEVYANQWHNDKPFSKNTLKIIIPQNNIDIDGGGIEILNISDSKIQKKNDVKISPDKVFRMLNKVGDILLFLPNLCCHRAGIPRKGAYREQIMIQLNPAKEWFVNNSIYKKQLKIEPKFPALNYFFDKKNSIDIN